MILPPRFKRCPACQEDLPRDEHHFSPHRRKTGVITYDLCRPCAAERSRARYRRNMEDPYLAEAERRQRRQWEARNPRKVKEAKRRRRQTRREKYKNDTASPEMRDAILDRQRINYALRAQRDNRAVRTMPKRKGSRTLYTKSLRQSEHFDPEPFREWVRANYPETPYVDLAKVLGVNERTLTAVMVGPMLTVSVRFVDRAFVTIGRPDLLNLLYPLRD
jgi:hypothetical protein